jgi:hypothetical protein
MYSLQQHIKNDTDSTDVIENDYTLVVYQAVITEQKPKIQIFVLKSSLGKKVCNTMLLLWWLIERFSCSIWIKKAEIFLKDRR